MESDTLGTVFTLERLQGRAHPPSVRGIHAMSGDDEQAPELSLHIERRGGLLLVQPKGQLVEETCGLLRDRAPALLAEPCQTVAILMHQVLEIDNAGLGLLISVQKQLTDKGRRLVLVGCTAQIRRALRVTRLEVLLPQVSSLRQLISP
jgi:anti-anti-sigma factor